MQLLSGTGLHTNQHRLPSRVAVASLLSMFSVAAVCLAADMKALQPDDNEVKELRNHVIIAGYGRVGQIIAQMLSELLIPFVALDVRSDRCAAHAGLKLSRLLLWLVLSNMLVRGACRRVKAGHM
jgi:phosphoglycerate dehydrogenase-like enzyme